MSAGKAVAKAIEFLLPIVKTWRSNELGKKLVRRIAPRFAERRAAKRAQRAARKTQRQRRPDEAEGQFFSLDEDRRMAMPKNTMRKSGVALVGLSPVIGVVVATGLKMAGVGEECTPEAIELGCQTAEQIATTVTAIIAGVVSGVGGVMYWIGFNRAKNRGE